MKALALMLLGAILCPTALAQQSTTPEDLADLPTSFTTEYATNTAYKVTIDTNDGSDQVLEVPQGTRLIVQGWLPQNQRVRGKERVPNVFKGVFRIRMREQTTGHVLREVAVEDANVLVESVSE